MADNPTCASCRWWDAWHDGAISGNCHRYAPRPGDEGGDWPGTSSAMWCGEHAPRVVVGVDFASGDDRTVIVVPTAEELVSVMLDHGADVRGTPAPGDSFAVGRVTWLYRPKESPDASV